MSETQAATKKFAEHKKRDKPLASIESLREMLDDAIFGQEQALYLVQEAIGEATDSKMATLLAVHKRALELRLRLEAQYREGLERQEGPC